MAATVYIYDLPTGLTLTLDKYPHRSDTAAATGVSITEATNAKTTYTYSESTHTGLHHLVVKSGSNVIGTRWAVLSTTTDLDAASELIDIKVAQTGADGDTLETLSDQLDTVTATIGGNSVTVTSPVISDEEIELVIGDDYYNADGRALSFTFTGITADWTSATSTLRLTQGLVSNTISGTIVTATGSTRVCRFEIATTVTDDYQPGAGPFYVGVVLSGGHITTPLTEGRCIWKVRT